MRRVLVLLLTLVPLVACSDDEEDGPRPSITTSGLHQACPESGCAAGQDCIEVAHPETTGPTCEIGCSDDLDCPEGTSCNVPPLVPDMVAYICD